MLAGTWAETAMATSRSCCCCRPNTAPVTDDYQAGWVTGAGRGAVRVLRRMSASGGDCWTVSLSLESL